MPRVAPPPDGHHRCNWCRQDFLIGTGAPSRTRPGVTLKTCSVACRDQLSASVTKYQGTGKGKASVEKHNAMDKRKLTQKRGDDAAFARMRACPKLKLKKHLGVAAHQTWTGKAYLVLNKCKILAQHTPFQTPAALRKVLRERATAAGIPVGTGSVAHCVIAQEWYDFGNAVDVRRCWDARNLGVQTVSQNSSETWHLHPDRVDAHPVELFPTAYPKDVMLAAARHDRGVDLHSELVLARAREAEA